MVLPGVQALFGFQLIAVFNESLNRKLSMRWLHLLALSLITIAGALVMPLLPIIDRRAHSNSASVSSQWQVGCCFWR